MSFAVVIPSKTFDNLVTSLPLARGYEPEAKIVVIDDGIEFPSADAKRFVLKYAELIPGISPFVFARNMNIGIQAAGSSDVVLLNDDALLKTPGGFSRLQQVCQDRPEIGILAPVTNVTGAADQKPQGIGVREVSHIAFVCVYIPRRTLDAVGVLDERFVTYGWEDNDYCHRVKREGLKIAVHDDVFIDHGSLRSTFRGGPLSAGDIEPGRKIFREKWGWAP